MHWRSYDFLCIFYIQQAGYYLNIPFLIFVASCIPLPELSNGKLSSNNTNHGALVSILCNKGFQLKGSKQILCSDGKWNASSPLCKGLSHSTI